MVFEIIKHIKTRVFFAVCTLVLIFCGWLCAYESGDEFGFCCDEMELVSRLTYFSFDEEDTPEEKRAKTHCARTAEKVIEILTEDKTISKQQEFLGNVNDLKKDPLFDLLFEKDEKSLGLYVIDICGGHHVCIVEKISKGWKIWQSWLDEFTLRNWVDGDASTLDPTLWQEDFETYSGGRNINRDQLHTLLNKLVKEGRRNIALNYLSSGGNLPVDFQITYYCWNNPIKKWFEDGVRYT